MRILKEVNEDVQPSSGMRKEGRRYYHVQFISHSGALIGGAVMDWQDIPAYAKNEWRRRNYLEL